MANRKKAIDRVTKLVAILEPLEREERARIVRAALALVGESGEMPSGGGSGGEEERQTPLSISEKAYFDSKEPRTKGEELAVAARYREERQNATASSKADLEQVTRSARRNFDGKNFRRDLENARAKGLFTRGTGKDSIVLSHYGQNYVDVLPNRDALKSLQKPKRGGARRRGKKAAGQQRKS